MQELVSFLSQPIALVILALVGFIALVYIYGTSGHWVLRKMNVPGAKPLPYVGNLRDLAKAGGFHLGVQEYYKKYGSIFSLCVGRKAAIVIADPELIKQIMVKDFHNFVNHFVPIPPPKDRKRLIEVRDEQWKRIRSTFTPVFTSGKLKVTIPLIEKSAHTLVEKMEKIADTGRSVDVFQWFSQMTLEVIISAAFGIQSPIQSNPDNEFIARSRKVFGEAQVMIRFFLMFPFSHLLVRVYDFFNDNIYFFRNAASGILNIKKEQSSHHAARDLVDIMLSAKNPDGTRKLDDDEIISQSITFFLGGHETTSNALTMTAYYLALNPDIQERLRNEISEAQEAKSGEKVYDLIADLEYLDCVINEVLRLSPPGHSTNRECAKQYDINGATIPKGMQVIIPIYTLHHDPQAWPEPEKFDPERFRGPAKESRHPFQFLPFGEGPRNCIGKRFAMLEVKITLVNILTKYKFVRCPETQVPLKMIPGLTLIPKDGVFLRIESCI